MAQECSAYIELSQQHHCSPLEMLNYSSPLFAFLSKINQELIIYKLLFAFFTLQGEKKEG